MRNSFCFLSLFVWIWVGTQNKGQAQTQSQIKIKKNTVVIDEVPAFQILADAEGNGFDLLTLKGDTLVKIRHRAYKNPDNYTPQNPTGTVDYYEIIFPTLGNKVCEVPYPSVPGKRQIVNGVIAPNDVIWDNEVNNGAAEIMVTTYGRDFSAVRDTIVRKYGKKSIIIK